MLLRNFPERLRYNLYFTFSDFMKVLVLKYLKHILTLYSLDVIQLKP